uniref:hypothetical protein n=1 Tax=uncultured Tenacibaculum sp. TaxID=174713 RepID=UPI00261FA4D4|nr:hypothetical protein [uncultured Tenacibaculum sp.]
MKTITNKFKIALAAVGLLAIGTVSAQTTAGDITVQGATTLGNNGGTVKLVDNKGTIKYLQAENGLTSFTNTTPSGGVVTTWQLGGTLTENTYITAGTGTEFALDGLELVTAGTASTNAVDRESHDGDAATGGTGFTVLIRDEDSGAIQKIQLADLFQVTAIGTEYIQSGDASANVNIPVPGLPIIDLAKSHKLFVYRNGVKLRWGTTNTKDFNGDTVEQITINYDANDLPMYHGDVIEIQYIN